MKDGKWKEHPKAETKIEGSQEEWGVCPVNKQGERTDLTYLYEQIASDVPTNEIIEKNPKYMLRMTEIEKVRQMLLYTKYKSVFKELDVTYIWGDSGTGSTVSSHLRTVLPVATVANMLGHLEETNERHYNYDVTTDEVKVNYLKEMYETFKKTA